MGKPTYTYCPQCGNALTEADRSGEIRKICIDTDCGFVHWDNPIPVVAAIATRGEEVYLVRSIGWPDKWFGLVTGFMEKAEKPEEAVLREVKEELGLEGEVTTFIGHYPFRRMNQIIIVYHVALAEGEVQLDTSELEGWKKVPIEKIRPWPMGTGKALKDWLSSQGYEREFIQFG
ncbi:MAG: NUDIX domain-containing protein [Bacteroidota bacterium]